MRHTAVLDLGFWFTPACVRLTAFWRSTRDALAQAIKRKSGRTSREKAIATGVVPL